MQNPLFNYLPNLDYEEAMYIQNLTQNMTPEQLQSFANIYMARRKDPMLILILTIIGFFGVAGIQRFVLNSIGMGVLYLFTGGLCMIGTIVDLVNYKRLTNEYNFNEAQITTQIVLNNNFRPRQ